MHVDPTVKGKPPKSKGDDPNPKSGGQNCSSPQMILGQYLFRMARLQKGMVRIAVIGFAQTLYCDGHVL